MLRSAAQQLLATQLRPTLWAAAACSEGILAASTPRSICSTSAPCTHNNDSNSNGASSCERVASHFAASSSSAVPAWWLQNSGFDAASHSRHHSGINSWSSSSQHQQTRGYKSLKRSMKPLNTHASWEAARPYIKQEGKLQLQQAQQRQKQQEAPVVDTCIPEIPEVPRPPVYRRVGAITSEYKLETEPAFAVVEIGGTQFKVTTDDVIFVPHLGEAAVNEVLSLERVMLVGTRSATVIGRPYVPGTAVLAAVEEHFKDGKVHVFKFKKRKRYRKYAGPRPALTTLRILQVQGLEQHGEAGVMGHVNQLPIAYYDAITDSDSSSEGSSSDEEQHAKA